MEEETPGSQATREPAALPVKIPLMILFRESFNPEVDSSGISEPVNRLMTSWEAPKSPLRRGRSTVAVPKLITGDRRSSRAKAKSPRKPVIKNRKRAEILYLYFARRPCPGTCSPFSPASIMKTTESRTQAMYSSRKGYAALKNKERGSTKRRDAATEPALPRAESRTASAPAPSRSSLCPGRTARAVSPSGAPRNTEGTMS